MRTATRSLLLLGAVACAPAAEPFSSDVLWIELTETGQPCASTEITENMTNAAPSPASGAAIETTMSVPGRYISVTMGENGTTYVNVDGDVLVGTLKDNGTVEATFHNEEMLDETRTAETYIHTRLEQTIFEQTLTLVPSNNEENVRYTGKLTVRDYFLLEVSENDEWDPDVVGTGATQMPETADYLVWIEPPGGFGNQSPINQEYNDDCPEDVCELRVFSDCTREFSVDAVRIEGADVAAFEVLQDYDQPEGVN